jgi:hypothetical protein
MNILAWAAALLALTLSCSKTPDIQDPEAGLPALPTAAHEIDRVPLTRAEEAFVQAGNQFAWKLTKKVWDEGEKKSLILSPLSVQYALGMLGNGADAEVSAQLAAVLGYEGTDAINEFCAKLIETLPQVDTSVTLALADGVLVNDITQEIETDQAGVLGKDAMEIIEDTEKDELYIDNEPDDMLYDIVVDHSMSYYRDVLGM